MHLLAQLWTFLILMIAFANSERNPALFDESRRIDHLDTYSLFGPYNSIQNNEKDAIRFKDNLSKSSYIEYDSNSIRQPNSKEMGSYSNSHGWSTMALLGLLYFMDYVQNFLQGTDRGKRSLSDEPKSNIEDNLNVIEAILETAKGIIPQLGTDLEKANDGSENCKSCTILEGRAATVAWSISSLFQRLKNIFGLTRTSRKDHLVGDQKPPSAGIWSILGEKAGLIVTIMDFLKNPEPQRLQRSLKDSLSMERLFSVFNQMFSSKHRILSRTKRYTDKMNSWYNSYSKQRENWSFGKGTLVNTILKMLDRS